MASARRMRRVGAAMAYALVFGACGGPTVDVGSLEGLPGAIVQTLTVGGPNPASPTMVPLENLGLCPLAFAVSTSTTGGSWLAASPPSGMVPAGGTVNLAVSFDAVTPGLHPGTYPGAIRITGTCADSGRPATGSPAAIAVNLTVTEGSGFTVGGTVSGLIGTGLRLQKNGGRVLEITADGTYTFPAADGSAYALAVVHQPTSPIQTCSVSNATGTVNGANVTNADVVCESIMVSVAPLYGGPLKWNAYVKNDGATRLSATGTPCTGSEAGPYGACLHAGEMLVVEVPWRTDCQGLTAADALGAFAWRCVPGSPTRMISTGLLSHKRLADLIEPTTPAWRSNEVVIFSDGSPAASTAPSVWHTNPVVAVPPLGSGTIALDGAETLYVLAGDGSGTVHLTQSGVGLVIVPGATLTRLGGNVDGAVAAPAGTRFLWIEGRIAGPGTPDSVKWTGVRFSVIRHVDAREDIRLIDSSSNRLESLRFGHSPNGLQLDATSALNTIERVVNAGGGVAAVSIAGSDNVLADVTAVSGGIGVDLFGSTGAPAASNVILGATAGGLESFAYRFNNAPDTTALNLVAVNDNWGMQLLGSTTVQIYDLASTEHYRSVPPAFAVTKSTGLATTFGGLFLVTDRTMGCREGTTTVDCGTFAASAQLNDGATVAASLVGPISVDDAINTSDASGAATFDSGMDFLGFENRYRGWGRDQTFPSDLFKGECSGANPGCRIADWSVRSADAVIRDRLAAPTGPSAPTMTHRWSAADAPTCAAIPGATWSTETGCTTTFVLHAMELSGDGVGNDNLLCEAGERCLHTPNLGAYQGHGNLVPAGAGGPAGDVELYRYDMNGR